METKINLELIADGKTGLQDVVRVEVLDPSCPESDPLSVSYMANVGGVGLDARVCEIVNRKKEQGYRGKKLYVSALLYCIRHRVPVRARIVCDGNEIFSFECGQLGVLRKVTVYLVQNKKKEWIILLKKELNYICIHK